jgi:hypothetical protein
LLLYVRSMFNPYWLSVYYWLLSDICFILAPYWHFVYFYALLTFNLLLTYWHSVYYWLTDIQSIIDLLTFSPLMTPRWHPAGRHKMYNAQNRKRRAHKIHERSQQPFLSKLLTFWSWDFLKKISQSTRLWAGRSQDSNSGKGECLLCPAERSDWLWSLHSLLVSMYWTSNGG